MPVNIDNVGVFFEVLMLLLLEQLLHIGNFRLVQHFNVALTKL